MNAENHILTVPTNGFLLPIFIIAPLSVFLILPGELNIFLHFPQIVSGIVLLSLIPGVLFISLLGVEMQKFSKYTLFTLSMSWIISIVIGLVMSLLSPKFKYVAFSELPIAVGVTIISFVFYFGIRGLNHDICIPMPTVPNMRHLMMAILLVVTGIATGLVRDITATPIILVLVVLSTIPIIFTLSEPHSETAMLYLWAIAIVLVLHTTIGSEEYQQWIAPHMLEQGYWQASIGSGRVREAVLTNSILTPMLVRSTGLSLKIITNVFYPLLTSLIAPALYLIYRIQWDVVKSSLSVYLFIFSFPFFSVFPTSGRTAPPVLFTSLLVLVLLSGDSPLGSHQHTVLTIVLLFGINVSHYGTSFLILFALWAALLFLPVLGAVYYRLQDTSGISRNPLRKYSSVYIMLFIYTILNIYYYMEISSGYHFRSLVRKSIDAVGGILAMTFGGTATETISKSFGSTTISISRYIYIIFGVLMMIGLLIWGLELVTDGDEDDLFPYSLTTGFFGMFGFAILDGTGSFNIARIMMVIFIISAPLIHKSISSIHYIVRNFNNKSASIITQKRLEQIVAISLSIFLLLNSGVVSATITHEPAPTNSLLSPVDLRGDDGSTPMKFIPRDRGQDVAASIWIYQHHNRDLYGGYYASEIYSEFFLSELQLSTSFNMDNSIGAIGVTQLSHFDEAKSGDLAQITSINSRSMRVANHSWYNSYPIAKSPIPRRSDLIYTAGNTTVYVS